MTTDESKEDYYASQKINKKAKRSASRLTSQKKLIYNTNINKKKGKLKGQGTVEDNEK